METSNFADEDFELASNAESGGLPDFANAENKLLYEKVCAAEVRLQDLQIEYHKNEERVSIMIEHLKNVDAELIHTQALYDAKKRETENEEHLIKLANKESGKLNDDLKSFQKKIFDYQYKMNAMNKKIFAAKEKIENFRLQMEWNQDQLEQWTESQKQKEDDQLILEKYKRMDDAKVVSMNVQIEKLSSELQLQKQKLEKEITETKVYQIELDNAAKEFKKLHDERTELHRRLQESCQEVIQRDREISSAANQIDELKKQQDEKEAILGGQKQLRLEYSGLKKNLQQNIVRREKEQERVRQVLFEQKQIRENLRDELRLKETELQKVLQELKATQKEYESLKITEERRKKEILESEKKFKKQCQILEEARGKTEISEDNSVMANKMFKEASEVLESMIAAENESKTKKVQKAEKIFQLRESKKRYKEEVNGCVLAFKNLQNMIKMLDEESLKQQEILYGYNFEIQQLERKVQKASGKRSVKESKQLNEKIEAVKGKVEEETKQKKLLQTQISKLEQHVREYSRKENLIAKEISKYQTEIEEIKLKNESIKNEIQTFQNKKNQISVEHDELKLKLNKIKSTLLCVADEIFEKESQKTQMELDMEEKRKEIESVQAVLKKEIKLEKQEISKLNIELKNRKAEAKKLQYRYTGLTDILSSGEEGQNSQAYHIIKLAQERSEVEGKGDMLNEQIQIAEKEIIKLHNTLNHLTNKNQAFRKSLNAVEPNCPELDIKKNLKNQYQRIKEEIYEKNSIIKHLKSEAENNKILLKELELKSSKLEENLKKGSENKLILEKNLERSRSKLLREQKTYKKLLSAWRNKNQTQKVTNEEMEIAVHNEKREIRAILELITGITHDHPELTETIQDVFQHHEMDLVSIRRLSRSAATNDQSMKKPVENASDRSMKSQTSVVNIKFGESEI